MCKMEQFSTELWGANSTWSPIELSACSRVPERNSCMMTQEQNAKRDVIAFTRCVVSVLSIIGALSIIISVSVKKQMCSPKIHPIFMLSIADCLLATLWIVGGALWLQGSTSNINAERVGCFTVLLMTVILECVTTNLTLVYALLAYSGIKQWDFSNVYSLYRQQEPGHIWRPYKIATAYTIAWLLPVILIMTPFGIIAAVHHIVKQANTCSCWCLPYFGNVVPLSWPGDKPTAVYLYHMRMFIASYGVVVGLHYIIVFTLLVIIYWKILRKIRQMRIVHERNKTTQNLYGATEALIIKGQSQAKARVIYFLTSFVIVGFFNMFLSFVFTVFEFTHLAKKDILQDVSTFEDYPPTFPFILYILQSITVPLQGFLNAIVYGWTREDFLSLLNQNKPLQPNAVNDDREDEDEKFLNSEEIHQGRDRQDYSYTITLDSGRGNSSQYPRPGLGREYLFTVSEEIEDGNN